MASYSYRLSLSVSNQGLQYRLRQPLVLEQIRNLQPGPTLTPPLPALSLPSPDPFDPPLEGKALSLSRSATPKQVPARLVKDFLFLFFFCFVLNQRCSKA
jgi:hypothetical protein